MHSLPLQGRVRTALPAWAAVTPVRGSELRGAEGPWLRKCPEVETDLAGRRRETTENPQVTQHQHVTRSETLQLVVCYR